MEAKHLKWLYDIKVAIVEIEGFLEDNGKTFDAYQNNLLLKILIEVMILINHNTIRLFYV